MKLPWDHPSRTEKSDGYRRERSADPYHTARWTRLSRAFRAEHPLCAECASNFQRLREFHGSLAGDELHAADIRDAFQRRFQRGGILLVVVIYCFLLMLED